MDWKQFIASIIGSVAWPVAAVVIALIFRRQLTALLKRLAELTLPGGYKFVFCEALEEGREAVDKIESDAPRKGIRWRTRDHAILEYRHDFQNSEFEGLDLTSQMVAAYAVVEAALTELAAANGVVGTHWAIWQTLREKGVISAAAADALEKLRKARNALAHLSSQVEVLEAIEFVRQATILSDYLRGVLKKQPHGG